MSHAGSLDPVLAIVPVVFDSVKMHVCESMITTSWNMHIITGRLVLS